MGGSIHVRGNLGTPTTTARIASVGLEGFPSGVDVSRDITGSILIDGNLYGAQDALSAIETDNLRGQVYVNGSLINGAAGTVPEIRIAGGLQAGDAVSIDYDGWDAGDDWGSGATIRVGAADAFGDAPKRCLAGTDDGCIYHITECRGDMNNDGLLNFNDIDAFVAALVSCESYGAAYVGLGGSCPFHADANCDFAVDFNDIDPFTALLVSGCCASVCPCSSGLTSPGMSSGMAYGDPATIAALFLSGLSAERIPVFLDMVAVLVESTPDPAEAEFWSMVAE